MKELTASKKKKIMDQLIEGEGISPEQTFDHMVEKIARQHDVPKYVVKKIITDWSAGQGRVKTKK